MSFSDIFKSSFLENVASVSILDMVLAMVLAFGLGLFIYLIYRLFYIAQNAPDLYGALMVTGIFAHISLQVILNICVVLNLIPTTGITLPFVSYGGTSVVFLMLEMAIALSVAMQIRFRRTERDLWGEIVRDSYV